MPTATGSRIEAAGWAKTAAGSVRAGMKVVMVSNYRLALSVNGWTIEKLCFRRDKITSILLLGQEFGLNTGWLC